ncbi:hypothetical protein [Marinobacter sp. NFXS9]|uniref:AbiTii domain-containing protein n=1 Tax=Marinobacter sp. NFXS9 TaxID=2818433 RepID=UPI0032DE46EA
METPVDDLDQRLQDASDPLTDIMPAAITLAMMCRHRTMANWLRTEFDGYHVGNQLPPYRIGLPGHIVARSPQYGWIPAPIDDDQKETLGQQDLHDGVKSLEKICLACKRGSGHRIAYDPEVLADLQSRINLSAELAITVSRDTYSDLLRVIRSTIYLWTQSLMEAGLGGAHNSLSKEEREQVAHLDDPTLYWRRAMTEVDSLPVPGVRNVGFLERLFGGAG